MLKLEGFGLTLELLTAETAELVRVWRNQPEIVRFMEYREFISEESQQAWLQQIDPSKSAYFFIRTGNTGVGMIHLAAIDPVSRSAEAGLFIGNSHFSGTGVTLGASLLLLDHAFDTLQLESVFAKVQKDNTEAEKYNQFLGFRMEKELNSEFNLWKISRPEYMQKRDLLKSLIA